MALEEMEPAQKAPFEPIVRTFIIFQQKQRRRTCLADDTSRTSARTNQQGGKRLMTNRPCLILANCLMCQKIILLFSLMPALSGVHETETENQDLIVWHHFFHFEERLLDGQNGEVFKFGVLVVHDCTADSEVDRFKKLQEADQ
jgi:hypothetical protein